MAKMFYTLAEVAQKLGKSEADVKQMADDGSLQIFRDGEKMMFKCSQIDSMAGTAGDRISLSGDFSADSINESDMTGTGITIFDSDQIKSTGDSAAGTKFGTQFGSQAGASMSASGTSMSLDVTGKSEPIKPLGVSPVAGPTKISVFDPDEVHETDSMSATHANAKFKDEDLALESVGSGSGLLDLTRETDDTSLGAELLDEIYPSGNTESHDIKMDTAAIGSTGIFDSNLRTAKVQQESAGIGEGSGSAFGSLSDTGSAPAFSGSNESSFGASLASAPDETGTSSGIASVGSRAGKTGSSIAPSPTKTIVTPSSLQMASPVEHEGNEDPTSNLFMSATLAFALLAALISLFAIIPSLQGITGKITDTLVGKDNIGVYLFGAMFAIALVLGCIGLIPRRAKHA